MNQLEAELRLTRKKLALAMDVIDKFIEWFDNVHRDGKELKQVKSRIESMNNEVERPSEVGKGG
jgi:hypothetical protein